MNTSIKVVWLPRENIGLVKEIDTLVHLLEQRGQVERIIANPAKLLKKLLFHKSRVQPITLFSYNISVSSWIVLLVARLLGVRLVQFLHEPGMENKLNYGYVHALKIFLVELLVSLNVLIADYVVTFSEQAHDITSKKFPKKQVQRVQLLPYEKVRKQDLHIKRQYPLIFIGTIHPAKNFDIFLKIAKLIYDYSGCKSKLISRSTRYIENEGITRYPYLDIVSDAAISDKVIERGLSCSSVLFKMDKNMMQSGLVAQSMYFGTVCLLNNIKGFQQDFDPVLHLIFSSDSDPRIIANKVIAMHQADSYENLKSRVEICGEIHNQKLNTWDELFNEIEGQRLK